MAELDQLRGKALLERIRSDFIGLNTEYLQADGQRSRRLYLDSTASTLMLGPAFRVIEQFLEHYANTHSLMHFSAKIATHEYDWAHRRILSFLGADPQQFTCFFTGSGTTAGMNRLARVFRDIRPDKDTAVISIMEHHSNDLPHRKHMQQVIHVPVEVQQDRMMCVSLPALEQILKDNEGRVNYVAMTAVSNVTGIINPIREIARLAHRHGALFIMDAAQSAAHLPIDMASPDDPEAAIDALVFSGHKTYLPGSPGVVVARREHLLAIEPEEVGGGMVDRVLEDRYIVKAHFPDREEAGTPNIPGAIALAATIEILDRIGMDVLQKEEDRLIEEVIRRLKEIPGAIIYGDSEVESCPRAGSVAFNLKDLDHGFVAAALNDYYNIAVRNQCFCAHPYVKEMMIKDLEAKFGPLDFGNMGTDFRMKAGMVRASFGLYSTLVDVDRFVGAVESLWQRREELLPLYEVNAEGEYFHRSFRFDHQEVFSINRALDHLLQP